MNKMQLNMAVANAADIEVHEVRNGGFILRGPACKSFVGMPVVMWNPVDDIIDAMEAGIIIGMFDEYDLQKLSNDRWGLKRKISYTYLTQTEKSCPHAICEAVVAYANGAR